jgi:hypothetical protein
MAVTRSGGMERRREGNRGSSSRISYNETLTRPAWDDSVKATVYEAAKVGGKYKCAISGKLCEKGEMSIDHIINWDEYCRTNADIDDKKSIYEAYNDIRNLRLVSRSENSKKGNRRGGNALRKSS